MAPSPDRVGGRPALPDDGDPSPLEGVLRRRRMVRDFDPEPVGQATLDRLLDHARRAPSAGNTQAVEFLVLDGPATADYWDVTLPEPKRDAFRWQGLLAAPTLVLVLTRPDAYRQRYAEPDKGRAATLGATLDAWPVPFWWVDAGTVIENLLLLVTEAGLGACLFGAFDHEAAVVGAFGVPSDRRLVATIAIGRPRDGEPGRSAGRRRPPLEEIRFRGRWPDPNRSQ